ncbi:MAG: hypothetical protein ACRDTF_21700 [Pseudonocardiaceae bacterium]
MDKAFFIGLGVVLLIVGFFLLVKPNAIPATQIPGFVFPVGVALLILGLMAAAFPFSPYFTPSTSGAGDSPGVVGASQTPTASATPAPTVTATPVPIAITSPTNGAGVSGIFTVSGTAPDLGGDKLWLFVWDYNATVPGKVFYRESDAPIDVASGFWGIEIGPLGEPGEGIGHTFTLRLVRANSQCSDTIANIAPTPIGEIFVRELPSGCMDAVPPVGVKKES